MKLNVGDVIEIGNKEATVCYENSYQEKRYICVFFSDKNPQYCVYKYKIEDNKLLVSQVEDKLELEEIMKIFIKDGIDEFGISDELNTILDYLEKKENNS